MFTITGIIAGEQEYITYHWNNGVGSYEGSPLAAFRLEGAQERTSPVGPGGAAAGSGYERSVGGAVHDPGVLRPGTYL